MQIFGAQSVVHIPSRPLTDKSTLVRTNISPKNVHTITYLYDFADHMAHSASKEAPLEKRQLHFCWRW